MSKEVAAGQANLSHIVGYVDPWLGREERYHASTAFPDSGATALALLLNLWSSRAEERL